MNPWLLTLSVAYLLGSIPFGYILVRLFRHEDIRQTGSGNIGATNVVRSGAKGLGIATLVLDCLKALAAVVIARHIVPGNPDVAAAAGAIAVAGHIFPVWLRFHGGKGVASALGAFLAICWPAALGALLVFTIVVWLSRYVSLASIAGAAALPIFVFLLNPTRSPIFIGAVLFIPLLVVLKHSSNIVRLRAGTESRFGSKAAPGAEKATV